MRTALASNGVAISIANKKLHAAKCAECGAKIYPTSLLKPHLTRHRLKHESLLTELRQLQVTIERMKIAEQLTAGIAAMPQFTSRFCE
jgi:hypothetical protein